MKIKLIVICIFGIILIAGGGFAALMSPFLTDSGTPQMIRTFYIVLACAIATVCIGLIMTIWASSRCFRKAEAIAMSVLDERRKHRALMSLHPGFLAC